MIDVGCMAASQGSTQKGQRIRLVGISFPFRKEDGKFPAVQYDVDIVQNDLITLFKTPIRTRVMRPTFGTTAYELVFESVGPLLEARMQRSIRQTISMWEPRVRVLSIEISDQGTEMVALVQYEVYGIQDFVELQFEKANEPSAA